MVDKAVSLHNLDNQDSDLNLIVEIGVGMAEDSAVDVVVLVRIVDLAVETEDSVIEEEWVEDVDLAVAVVDPGEEIEAGIAAMIGVIILKQLLRISMFLQKPCVVF
jgi:hypothetical protein